MSVSPSHSQYNDSLHLSVALMPIVYLSRLSHTFIYESTRSVRGGVSLDCQISVLFYNCSSHIHISLIAFSRGPQAEVKVGRYLNG